MPRLTCSRTWRLYHLLVAAAFGWLVFQTAAANTLLAQTSGSHRMTPLVRAVASCKDAVVNIRGRKSISNTSSTALSTTTRPLKQVNGMGTGVIIDPRGYVLTNYHVVEDVKQIKVTTNQKESYIAQLLAFDQVTDLAIIKIASPRKLPVIHLGSSRDAMLGETVVAIGNAYGYEHTITVGVISNLKRKVQVSDDQVYDDLIQTDASINPGNSGGPLINLDGEMIGVNVAVRVNAQGIAFAIPIDSVMAVAAKLMGQIVGQEVYAGVKTKTIYQSNQPLTVVETVDPESPAARAGLRVGDQIRSVAGRVCGRSVDLQTALLDRRPGQQITIVAETGGQQRQLDVKLGMPKLNDQSLVWKSMGLRLAPVDQKMMRHLAVGFDHGLKVTLVRMGSPADRGNILPGDILVAMDGWKTETLENVAYVLNQKHVQESKPFDYYLFRGKQSLKGSFAIRSVGTMRR